MKLEAVEAVAIAQQLIQSLRGGDAGEARAAVRPANGREVVLSTDGSVSCAACGSTPAISEIAIFLDALLPPGSPRVPGGAALHDRARVARGGRRAVRLARRVLAGAHAPRVRPARRRRPPSAAARGMGARGRVRRPRRSTPRPDNRIAARAARSRRCSCMPTSWQRSCRLRAEAGAPCGAPVVGPVEQRPDSGARRPDATPRRTLRAGGPRADPARRPPPARTRPRTVPAIAVCLGSGLMLISAGEFMHRLPATEPVAAPVVAPLPLAAARTTPVATMAPTFPLSERTAGARARAATVPRVRAAHAPQRARRQPSLRISCSPSASCPRRQPASAGPIGHRLRLRRAHPRHRIGESARLGRRTATSIACGFAGCGRPSRGPNLQSICNLNSTFSNARSA